MKYLAFIIFVTLLACKKSDDNTLIPMCHEQYIVSENENIEIDCSCPIECQELLPGTRYDYFYPSFNPNNEDEFVYIRYDNTQFSLDYDLYKFDLCSQEATLIHDDALGFTDWSVKDWIVFVASDYMIYKIKPSGDSLTQLTFSGNFNRRPIWNYEGTKLSYNTQTGSNQYNIIADENAIPIDTVEFIAGSSRAWNENDMIPHRGGLLSEGLLKIGYYNLFTKQTEFVSELEVPNWNNDFSIKGITWLNTNEIIWSAKNHVGITNIENGATDILLNGFENRDYSFLAVNNSEQSVILNRIDIETTDSTFCQIDTKHRLYLLDIEAKTERWIEIPE